MAVFGGGDESLDHLGLPEVAAERVEFAQPEVITVEVRVGRLVRVASEVADVLRQHERLRELARGEVSVLSHLPQPRF